MKTLILKLLNYVVKVVKGGKCLGYYADFPAASLQLNIAINLTILTMESKELRFTAV